MQTAFQADAFQNDAFQIAAGVTAEIPGANDGNSGRRRSAVQRDEERPQPRLRFGVPLYASATFSCLGLEMEASATLVAAPPKPAARPIPIPFREPAPLTRQRPKFVVRVYGQATFPLGAFTMTATGVAEENEEELLLMAGLL